MKKFKVCLAALLFCACIAGGTAGAFSLSYAEQSPSGEQPQILGGKNNVDEFLLSSWISFYPFSIKSYEEQLEDLKKDGLNFIWHTKGAWADDNVYYRPTPEKIEEVYAKAGMKYLLDVSEGQSYTKEQIKNAKNAIGYYVKDEPSAAQFDQTAELFKKWLTADESKSPMINLYPNYAGTTALGGTYSDYVNNWIDCVGAENIEYLYYDHYPFTGTETVRSSYFSDMETIRKAAYRNGRLKTGGLTQSGWWAGMRKPNADEFRWNVNTYVAYGFKSISHFCWVSPKRVSLSDGGEDMRDHVIDYDGNKTDLYEPATYYNWQIRQLGDLLMSIDCKHAYHSGKAAEGAEELPKSFFIQPENKTDKFIISVFTNKDDSENYVMIMNNSTSEQKNSSFSVSASAGVQKFIRFDTTIDRNNLPDPENLKDTLGELKQTEIDVNGGSLSESFLPGEIKIYKLEGENVVIDEALELPEISLASGTYTGEQKVRISSSQNGVELFYTTDGSYPAVLNGEPQGTTKRYDSKVKIGETGKWEYIPLRVIAYKNGESTKPVEHEYFIGDASRNLSRGKDVYFYDINFKNRITVSDEKNEVASGKVVTDGYHDPYTEVFTETGNPGWAVVDLGEIVTSGKIVTSFWANWEFTDVVIQISPDSRNWTTVFNNDTDGSLSFVTGETGKDGKYTDSMYSGNVFDFTPQSFRYVRVTNVGAGGGVLNGKSIWQEISVFSSFDISTIENAVDLLNNSDLSEWNPLGGANFTIENGTIKIPGSGEWGRAVVYKNEKYKNFVIEGTFSMTDVTGGLVGFELYKTTYTGALNGKNGYVVFIENGGRVGAYDGVNGGSQEFGATNVQATNFTPDSFTMRLVSINNYLSLSINGVTAYTVRNDRADMAAGYIAVHAGTIGITVKDLWIKSLDGSNGIGLTEFEDNLDSQSETIKTWGELYDSKDSIIEKLPEKANFVTVGGKTVELELGKWTSENYDRKSSGWYDFTAPVILSGNSVLNVNNLVAEAKIWVRAVLDTEAIYEFIAKAESLNESDYTPESWRELKQKLATAKEILADPYAVQNSVGVASFQLKDAIDALVSVNQNKTKLNALISQAESLNAEDYTKASYENFVKMLDKAKAVNEDNVAVQKDIDAAESALNQSIAALIKKGDKQKIQNLIAGIKAMDLTLYEAGGVKKLNAALSDGEDLLKADEISKEQENICIAAINNAKNALKVKSTGKNCKSSVSCGGSLSVLGIAALISAINKKRKK